MSDELKPCPFCGNEKPTLRIADGWHYVHCPVCGADGSADLGQSGAAESWNKRPAENQLRACADREAANATTLAREADQWKDEAEQLRTELSAVKVILQDIVAGRTQLVDKQAQKEGAE